MDPIARLRQDAKTIIRKAIEAVNPKTAICSHVQRQHDLLLCNGNSYDLSHYRHIYLVGAGKAGASMAAAMEKLLDNRLTAGVVVVKYGHLDRVVRTTIVEAGHPLPDQAGVDGARQLTGLLEKAGPDDLVICVISGGGSALLPLPADGLTLADKQAVTQTLLACGADITEINTIRKHLSGLKGGQLARLASPATVLSLILSDVIGDPLASIASGPTVGDPSTFGQCLTIISNYGIEGKLPPAVIKHLQSGAAGAIAETPKPGDPLFSRVANLIVANNRQAVTAAAAAARILGYHPLVLSTFIEGETREIARMHGAIAKEVAASGNPVTAPACIISGGETTVTIAGSGLGGRNQEFVLAAALEIENQAHTVIVSVGTDGTDGPTDAAGAVADGLTVARAKGLQLTPKDYLTNNDAYHFFDRLGDLVKTGPTNTNVMDLRLMLIANKKGDTR
ncbi:MAG: glycerate kinase [Deltaproteobacteria bacterium]|nr:glycerate kinase [Candidatus Anaeroferrophillus wilburensis]MBN2889826.1 glycerate kinase [Deltaproteobacteria bacterium]